MYFEGANQVARLSVNGQFIGEHKGGYTSFAFDISNAVGAGDNQIEIAVSNQYDVNIPPLSMDYIFYGGYLSRCIFSGNQSCSFRFDEFWLRRNIDINP